MLLVAAALKWHALVFAPDPFISRWTLSADLALIAFEIALAFLLIFNVFARAIRWFAAGVFGFFAIYNLFRMQQGYATCGCFGQFSLAPKFTAVLDFALAVALVIAARRAIGMTLRASKLASCGAALLVVIPVTASGAIVAVRAHDATGIRESVQTVSLKPSAWVGRRLPILPYISIPNQNVKLEVGRWKLVLFNHSCGYCLIKMPAYAELAKSEAEARSGVRVAVIDVLPPSDALLAESSMKHDGLAHGFLDPSRTWIVPVPTELSLVDGNVIALE